MRKFSLALLVAIALTLGACSTSGSKAGTPTTSAPTSTSTTTAGSKSGGTVSQETQQLNQELANLQNLLGQTNSDFASGQQDS
jgi:hypothetical protein